MDDHLARLNKRMIECRKCPRLVTWREEIARIKKRAYQNWKYWGKPVPGFGDIHGKILVIGLAPGAHGSNRTGRMFTGDASGDFLYPALFKAGFATQEISDFMNDGLHLLDVFISAVCRCAPPNNKPLKAEVENCRDYLRAEIQLMKNLKGIIALGRIAFDQSLLLLREIFHFQYQTKPKFIHGGLYIDQSLQVPWLISSYHPSRQNTQTGRLTPQMFSDIWKLASNELNRKYNSL